MHGFVPDGQHLCTYTSYMYHMYHIHSLSLSLSMHHKYFYFLHTHTLSLFLFLSRFLPTLSSLSFSLSLSLTPQMARRRMPTRRCSNAIHACMRRRIHACMRRRIHACEEQDTFLPHRWRGGRCRHGGAPMPCKKKNTSQAERRRMPKKRCNTAV